MSVTVAELVATLGIDDQGFGGKLDGLLGQFGSLKGIALGAGAVVAAGLVAGGLAALHFGEQFDEAFDSIRIGTGATGEALAGLEDDFKKVVSSVPTDFASAGTAISDLNTRLGLTGRPLQDLSEQFLELSRITGTDVSANIRDATRLFGDWSVSTEDQAGTLDQLFRATQQSGMGLNDLMTIVVDNGATLRQLGFDLDSSVTMFAKFEKEGVNASKVVQGFGQLNKYATKEGRDGIDVWNETIEAIKNGTEAEGKSIGQKVFGVRAANDMVAAIREERFSYDDLKASIKGGGDTIMKAAADTADWRESLTLLKNQALVALEPALTKAFSAVSRGVEAARQALTSDEAKGIFDTISGAAGAAKDKIVDAFNAVWPIIGPVISDWIETTRVLLDKITPIVKAVFDAIVQIVKWAWPYVKEIILGALQVIAGIMRAVMAVMRGDWSGAWDAIKEIVRGAGRVLSAVVQGLADGLRGILSAAWGAIKSLAASAWNGIVGVVKDRTSDLVSFVRELPGRIRDALGDLGRLLYNAGVSLISGLLSGVRDKLSDLWGEVSSIAGKIRDLKGPLDYDRTILRPAGREIMAGLVDGIDAGMPGLAQMLGVVTRSISLGDVALPDLAQAGALTGLRPVYIASGAVVVHNEGISAMTPAQLTAATRAGVDPALAQLARAIIAN